jgi:peptidoglycan DL-endopeptidase CwlO
MTAMSRRWSALTVSFLVAALVLLVPAGGGVAAPADPAPPDGEAALLAQVEAASRGYLDAQAALQASQRRQDELTAQLSTAEVREAQLTAEVGDLASAAYRNAGGVPAVSALLSDGSPGTFLDRATTVAVVGSYRARQLHGLVALRANLATAKSAIDAEVANQRRQLAEMARKKADAERALAAAGSGASDGPGGSSAAVAAAAPRRADGSWPPESCSVPDPTTSGCITPRMLHLLQQARAAGFTRYVSCYRSGGSGEHPKGRACDFAAATDGFGGVATGGDRTYGNNLAAYLLANAGRLAVLYVIWFRQIWLPSSGWRAYSGGGDPSSDHTNHVHASVY